jgi:hypothetical protein
MQEANRWKVLLVVFAGFAMRALAANAPAEAPLPDPAVHEYRLERTSAPIGLVTDIPPPLPLDEVRQIRRSQPTTRSITFSDVPPSSRPKEPYRPLIPTRATVPLRNRPQRTASGVFRVTRPRPTPRVVLRSYPDRIVLVGGKSMRCRVIQEKSGSISMELENGATVDMPRARIQDVTRKAENR